MRRSKFAELCNGRVNVWLWERRAGRVESGGFAKPALFWLVSAYADREDKVTM